MANEYRDMKQVRDSLDAITSHLGAIGYREYSRDNAECSLELVINSLKGNENNIIAKARIDGNVYNILITASVNEQGKAPRIIKNYNHSDMDTLVALARDLRDNH